MTPGAGQLVSGGKVVDGSALVAWATGSLAMATWRELAWADNHTFVVPIDAQAEAARARPNDVALVEYFLSAPNVVVRDLPENVDLQAVDDLRDNGVFDPLSTWVSGLCRRREWTVLTCDDGRLRRVDPDIDVTLV